jgi:hypothetical protein
MTNIIGSRSDGFIGTSVTVSLNYNKYSALTDLHTFQFTVANSLGFSASTSFLLAVDLNTETSTSNHYEVFLLFVVQSPCMLGTQLNCQSESESYITTNGQSVSLSWNKAPIWGLRPDFYYCQTVAGLLIWDAHSDKKTGLSFTITVGPRQHSHSTSKSQGTRDHIYCLRFETSVFITSYNSQSYCGGIQPRLHTWNSII